MVIFKELEKEARQELIALYEDYIEDKTNPDLEKRALWCEQKCGAVPVLSKEVAFAGSKSTDIAFKELSLDKAKEILESLK